MLNLGIGGDPQLQTRLKDARLFLDHIHRQGGDVTECRVWLNKAEEVSTLKIFLVFYPYSSYDLFWQSLHKLRHIFCRISPSTDLLSVTVDIRGCLSYISESTVRRRCESELSECENSLRILVGHYRGAHNYTPLSLEQIRYSLEELSLLSAEARDAHWRKVNLLRTRLMVMAWVLAALLLGLLFLVPLVFPGPDVDRPIVLAIIMFGALGGLVSALGTMEPLESPSSSYFLRRILLGLKPVVGAAGGLMLYLLQLSGVIVVVTASKNSTATYLTTAFLAGFSEKFFTSQLEKMVGGGGRKGKKQKADQDADA